MMHIPRFRNLPMAELSLIGVTILWGGTFLVVHIAVEMTGALFLVGLRFLIAGLLALLFCWGNLRQLTRTELFAGTAIGCSIFTGYGLQTYGLQTTESSTSAFLTALYVPLVPLLQWIVFRKPPALFSWLGIALAFVGLLLVSGGGAGALTLSEGEIATLIGTLGIAVEIMLIGYFAPFVDSRRVTVIQLLAVAAFAFACMPLAGAGLPSFSWVWIAAIGGLGAASAIIQLAMNWAQKTVSPTRATVIYAGEPVWAGILGRIAGERLGPLALVGGALIVVGVLVSELRPARPVVRSDASENRA
ncbi:MAG TPA: DMT family transporter [Paracoccus sp. (in: a-proteobacteria)]|uniref:DMT family transporter n=1 Tax=Paracoccus sp. TaxID=267 RepID=UPI002C0AE3B0|nr:DMT family transporter [Paracoccus sp. (in: a-proteobacteria)]HWL59251.1 DMT family transporter [Paracoccus sp. (in: a-proteobacteria)]